MINPDHLTAEELLTYARTERYEDPVVTALCRVIENTYYAPGPSFQEQIDELERENEWLQEDLNATQWEANDYREKLVRALEALNLINIEDVEKKIKQAKLELREL